MVDRLTEDEIKAKEKYEENIDWVNENHREIGRNYPEQWIAVYNKGIVSYSPDRGEVDRELDKLVAQRCWDKRECLVDYIEDPNVTSIPSFDLLS